MSEIIIHKGENCQFVTDGIGVNNAADANNTALGNSSNKNDMANLKFLKPIGLKSAIKKRTIEFLNKPRIATGSSVVCKREANGPIGEYFDIVLDDPKAGEDKFECAEIQIMLKAVDRALTKAGLKTKDIDIFFAGDLLNQITTSSYVARELEIPYLGLYSACSTMTETLAVAASMINAGYIGNAICSTVSHFATAERQFRYPLEYGCQRPPYAQWTVTGAGATILKSGGAGPKIVSATFGKVVDFGINDLSNMGAAMAPEDVIIGP